MNPLDPGPSPLPRVKLAFETVEALLAESQASAARGSARLPSPGELAVGAQLVVELGAPALLAPLEVLAEVEGPAEGSGGLRRFPARYLGQVVGAQAFDASMRRAFEDHQWERTRRYPRMPINFVADDPKVPGRRHFVRDICAGGIGVICPGISASPARRGDRMLLEAGIEPFIALELEATVVWASDGTAALSEARYGACFEELSEGQRLLIHNLLQRRRPLRAEATLLR
jgi:PilZ domain